MGPLNTNNLCVSVCVCTRAHALCSFIKKRLVSFHACISILQEVVCATYRPAGFFPNATDPPKCDSSPVIGSRSRELQRGEKQPRVRKEDRAGMIEGNG